LLPLVSRHASAPLHLPGGAEAAARNAALPQFVTRFARIREHDARRQASTDLVPPGPQAVWSLPGPSAAASPVIAP
jgi:hypothetical protein